MTPDQTLVARTICTTGYNVVPSSNGGFIVRKHGTEPGYRSTEDAAFTTAADLLAFLQAGHGVEGEKFVIPTHLLRTS